MALQDIQSTQGRSLNLEDYRGKTLVLFYESRDHTDDNLHLKESCGLLLESGTMGDRFDVLGIADVEGLGIVRSIVTAAVKAVAARYRAELWLDFSGALKREPWGLGGKGSAIAIIGPTGELVFRARGVVNQFELEQFFGALGRSLDHAGADEVVATLSKAARV